VEPTDLEAAVTQANEALAAIQTAHGRTNVPEARIRFPRGFILPAATYQAGLPKLGTKVHRCNASYALQAIDVFRWISVRTDLSGVALSMIIKEAICILGAICEWLTKEATRGDGARRSYTRRTAKLCERNVITQELKDELDWIWDVRCNEHLHEVQSLELSMYSRRDYNRALDAFKAFKLALVEIHGKAGG